MDGDAGKLPKNSESLDNLVTQTLSNSKELKHKLKDIIRVGKDYEQDVSSCLKTLINSSDREIQQLTIQAISELAKCDTKRLSYASKDFIEPIIKNLQQDVHTDNLELIKQCCRALGNLCCDCDQARDIMMQCDGVLIIQTLLSKAFNEPVAVSSDIKLLACKTLMNFSLGGEKYASAIMEANMELLFHKILAMELDKETMDDAILETVLHILGVLTDLNPDHMFEWDLNASVLHVLKETDSIDISELCLDHLHNQAEFNSIKALMAREGLVQLACERLEKLVLVPEEHGEQPPDEAETVIKQTCDLITIMLTGDEAMNFLYDKGNGEVYKTMLKWLNVKSHYLLSTAILAIGNFARRDEYCLQMMNDSLYDKLLDLFIVYYGHHRRMQENPQGLHPHSVTTLVKLQHAALAALRNLTVPPANKAAVAQKGKAIHVFIEALPHVDDTHVAYKLLACIRMLVDGQDEIAELVARSDVSLAAIARWGRAGEFAGAAGEAPRLLAWTARQHAATKHWRNFVKAEGCIQSLMTMTVAVHSIMQKEALVALTVISKEALTHKPSCDIIEPTSSNISEFDYEKSCVNQLLEAEVGKHMMVLIQTNNTKMPLDVVDSLISFMEVTAKNNKLATDYKLRLAVTALEKLKNVRKDLDNELNNRIMDVLNDVASNSDDLNDLNE